jgi:predicted nucleotidyltransferase
MNYTGNLPWLKSRTILYTLAGSRAYGMQTETSDWDYKGICIPPEEYRLGFLKRFDQAEFKPHDDGEAVVYDIQKFFKLAADCNPNILECIYCDDEDVLEIDDCGRLLRENRDLFLSKKALYTYRGYAMSQLKRMETHRKWLQNPPDHQPTRKEYNIERERGISSEQVGAALTAINNKIGSWEIDYGDLDEATKIYINEQIASYLSDITFEQKFDNAARILGFNDNFIEYLDKERQYKQALAYYNQYNEWKTNRNPKRAAIEAQFGADLKHASHLYRLMFTCKEILTEGKIYVKRPDAQELLAIRNGKYTFDEIIAWAKQQDEELIQVAKTSPLPNAPDRNKLDELCIEIIKMKKG